MPVRVPASEIYKIQEEDLREAIATFRERALPMTFEDSTRFDLLVDGYRRFPPKAILALAAQRPFGRVLLSSEFSGGESSTAFRLILARGFEFTTKITRVGELDATFSVGRNKESAFVLFESRGPDRNTHYVEGLEALLRGLADLDASIDDIVIDSKETRELPIELRRLDVRGQGYPLNLRDIKDMAALRRDITRAAAATGRGPDATGSGNPTKRLRLIFSEPEDLELFRIASFLAQNRGAPVRTPKEFVFRARAPVPGGGETDTRRAMEETDVTHIHCQMQVSLYSYLVAAHGSDSVSCEGPTASGRPADIIVRVPDGYELFEIKTALAPRDCVRQALGQLLEYAYWPGSPYVKALWVVGPSPIDSETEIYLDGLRERFGMSLGYRHQPVVTASPQGTPPGAP